MKSLVAWLALGIAGVLAGGVAADCCNDCGCNCQCCKVCRCVPETKKISKTCYDCECEDFCIPGKSKICGYKCPESDPCGDECHLFSCLHNHQQPIWQPTCAKVKTRNKLVKREIVKEVPGWRWEVVDLCPRCKSGSSHQQSGAQPTPKAESQHANGRQAGSDYYASDEQDLKPVAQPSPDAPPAEQKTQLASLTTAGKLKRIFFGD